MIAGHWAIDWAAVAAAAGALAAGAACWAAWETRRTAQAAYTAVRAQLLTAIRERYASEEMLAAISTLVRRAPNAPLDRPTDAYRRRVAYHFHEIAMLLKARLLDEETARLAAPRDEVAFACNVLEPIERLKTESYSPEAFDLLAALYGGRERLLALASPQQPEGADS